MAWLAIDLGGGSARIRDDHGAQTDLMWPAAAGAGQCVELLRMRIAEAVRQRSQAPDRVGLASAPSLDADGTVTAWPNRPEWRGTPLVPAIEDAAGTAVCVLDDGTAAALAEARAAGCRDLVYLGIGTGVGGGIISGGRPIVGAYGCAGELGHLVVDPRGPTCSCGRDGCVQAFAGARAVLADAGRRAGRPVDGPDLVAGYVDGEAWATTPVAAAVDALARVVVLISEICEPERVHLGGGLGAAIPDLPVLVGVGATRWSRPGRVPPVVAAARHGPEASLAGACLLAAEGLGPQRTDGRPDAEDEADARERRHSGA